MSFDTQLMPYKLHFFKDYTRNDYEEMVGVSLLPEKEKIEHINVKREEDRHILAKELNAYENTPYHIYLIRIDRKVVAFSMALITEYCLHLAWVMYNQTIGIRFNRLIGSYRIELHFLTKNEKAVPLLAGTNFIPNTEKDSKKFIEDAKKVIDPLIEKEDPNYIIVTIQFRGVDKALVDKAQKESDEMEEDLDMYSSTSKETVEKLVSFQDMEDLSLKDTLPTITEEPSVSELLI
jgi:hypothetical protein